MHFSITLVSIFEHKVPTPRLFSSSSCPSVGAKGHNPTAILLPVDRCDGITINLFLFHFFSQDKIPVAFLIQIKRKNATRQDDGSRWRRIQQFSGQGLFGFRCILPSRGQLRASNAHGQLSRGHLPANGRWILWSQQLPRRHLSPAPAGQFPFTRRQLALSWRQLFRR